MGKMGHRKAKRKNVGQKTRNYQKLGESSETDYSLVPSDVAWPY